MLSAKAETSFRIVARPYQEMTMRSPKFALLAAAAIMTLSAPLTTAAKAQSDPKAAEKADAAAKPGGRHNVDRKGLALRGFDPVAYFVSGKPEKGSDKFTATHQGVTYQFQNEGNRALFLAAPDKYAPQYGGYCAYAAYYGAKADADPTAWKIVDGKLYVNYDRGVARTWEKNIPDYVAKADANWPTLRDKPQ
jgi:YHS domain-containing protein